MPDQPDFPALGPSNYVDEHVFELVLGLEARQAVRLGYPLSILCFAPDIPRETIGADVLRTLAQATARAVRASDIVTVLTRAGGKVIALLLIDAEPETLAAIFERLRSQLEAFLPPYDGTAWQLIWNVGGSCYPRTVTRPPDLVPQAFELMVEARRTARERLSLLS